MRAARELQPPLVKVGAAHILARHPEQDGSRLGHGPEAGFAGAEGRLGLLAGPPLGHLLERPHHRWPQTCQPVFEQVIGRTLLHGRYGELFANGG